MTSGHFIEGATDSKGSTINHVCIDHRGAEIFVTEEVLNGTDIVIVFEEVGCEAVTKGMGSHPFCDVRSFE